MAGLRKIYTKYFVKDLAPAAGVGARRALALPQPIYGAVENFGEALRSLRWLAT